jgi:hypothetical protein
VDTETPRPEKLVVDFDTTVNSSPTDISGKGNHGAFFGTAQYSAADKAFKFDGSTDYIKGNLNNAGDTDFTVSLWLKKNTSGTYGTLWNFGGSGGSGNPEDSVAVQVTSGDRLDFFIFSGAKIELSNFGVDYLNKWVHIVATRTGIDLKIYLDGVDQNLSITGSAPTHTLQLAANTEYTIGARGTGALGDNSLNGYISNFKVYDVVLEPSEVQKLYRLGRTGRSMVISDTAVGIGKAPEAQLDVRGNLNVDGVIKSNSPAFSAYEYNGFTSTGGNTYVTLGDTFVNKGGCYDTSNGIFTAPISGTYRFTVDATLRSPGGTSGGGGTGATTITLHINNANWNPTNVGRPLIYQVIDPGTNHQHVSGSLVWNLTAGDTVRIYLITVQSGTDINFGEGYGRFIGYLIS